MNNTAKGLLLGGIIFSILPIWRSGEKYNLNLWQFMFEHSTFGPKRQYIEFRDFETREPVWCELVEGQPKFYSTYINGHQKGDYQALIEK